LRPEIHAPILFIDKETTMAFGEMLLVTALFLTALTLGGAFVSALRRRQY